ncbi:hypothetical protein [Chryseobacterium contaminans]|uniref:Uncharacterized protein n=2 Tax=Chryseobacterium contaminans TaxID=1423959 RepID=A0A1M6Y0V9_9FLAO|nr:hypothetical protein [Chryseobacterium contaminans]SHL11872.1 hypothetical protein SAMN05444407_102304 [Chryseobacterium contaminans]
MNSFNFAIVLAIGLSGTACAQQTVKEKQASASTSKKQQTMDLSKITDPQVKQAIEALQTGDKSWYSFFTENPAMTDDGNKVDFKSFFVNALGKELFLSIDRVENEGKDIHGNFKAGQWGTFPVFFKFHKNSEGKFDRLDIGQDK